MGFLFVTLHRKTNKIILFTMFKNYIGYHLEEQRRNTKYLLREATRYKRLMKLIFCTIVMVLLWNLPSAFFGIPNLTVVEQRTISVFCFATLMWILEPVPAWNTSVTLIVILLFCVSDSSLCYMREGYSPEALGTLLSHKKLMACFADPIIMLFIGGFILAIAATKSGLDVKLARILLKPFGTKSENVLLGFILITGIFSMFISNTATAAMMLTFLTPVFKSLPANGKGRIALTMAIPIGANIGGMGTPIGTPPNAFAYKTLSDLGMNIGFHTWMAIMVPMVFVMLIVAWYIVKKLFPFSKKTIELEISGDTEWNWRTWVVAITFLVTILLWIFGKDLFGINANTVAMLPIAVFAFTGVITSEDLRDIDWEVIWMVAGGFALGLAMNGTGLAENAVESIPFSHFNPIVILIMSGLICYLLSNFISNTATAALLIPILTVVCHGMGDKLSPIGGTPTIIIGIAIAASCAMMLPISTPPNAIAYSTGLIEQKDMAKAGSIVGIVSMIIGYSVLIVFCKLGIL